MARMPNSGFSSKPHRLRAGYSGIADKIAHRDIECVRDDLQRVQRHALAAVFQPVQMDAIEAGKLRKLILRDPLLASQRPDPFADGPVDVLRSLQSISLRVYAALKHPAYKQVHLNSNEIVCRIREEWVPDEDFLASGCRPENAQGQENWRLFQGRAQSTNGRARIGPGPSRRQLRRSSRRRAGF
jgi:hypothetical protein